MYVPYGDNNNYNTLPHLHIYKSCMICSQYKAYHLHSTLFLETLLDNILSLKSNSLTFFGYLCHPFSILYNNPIILFYQGVLYSHGFFFQQVLWFSCMAFYADPFFLFLMFQFPTPMSSGLRCFQYLPILPYNCCWQSY